MDPKEFKQTIGNLKISQEVIGSIASFATREVDGVAGMAQCPANIKNLLNKMPVTRSIGIELNDGIAVIDVYVKLRYGARIPDVAERIQVNVKEAVQNMTSIVVSKVNVFVEGIVFDEPAK